MQKTPVKLSEIKLIGIKARTNNAAEFDPNLRVIPQTIEKFFQEGLSDKISHRKKPGATYCVYAEYESDLTGDYTYFVGEEVTSFENVPQGLSTLTIPAQEYAKFTNNGPMPAVCINMWGNIWQMDANQLGGERKYIADFEIYDERAMNPQDTELDIFIGIKA